MTINFLLVCFMTSQIFLVYDFLDIEKSIIFSKKLNFVGKIKTTHNKILKICISYFKNHN